MTSSTPTPQADNAPGQRYSVERFNNGSVTLLRCNETDALITLEMACDLLNHQEAELAEVKRHLEGVIQIAEGYMERLKEDGHDSALFLLQPTVQNAREALTCQS